MEKQLYELTFTAEDEHWWFVGMRKITDNLLASVGFNFSEKRVLDVGAGTGYNVHYFSRYGQAVGIEPSQYAIDLAQQRGVKLQQGSAESLSYPDNSFDLVTCFDVLYHRGVNPEQAVVEMLRVLKPGGMLFVRNGAYQWMMSRHDQQGHTGRRYTAKSQAALFSGVEVLRSTYANVFLFPMALIKRLLESKFKVASNSVLALPPLFVNRPFTWILYLEAYLLKYFKFPFGLSVITVIRK